MPTVREPEVQRASLRDLLRGLEDTCAWLQSLGVPTGEGRFPAQCELTRTLVAAYEAHGTDAWAWAFPDPSLRLEALELMAEAIETNRIYQGLHDWPDAVPVAMLKRWASGPTDLSDERARAGETHGRDTAFELVMLSMLRECGLNPRYAEPDIVVELDHGVCLIACKRPRKGTSVGDNFRGACRQIVRHLKTITRQRPFGLIMLSLSKLYDHVPVDVGTAEEFEKGWAYLDEFRGKYSRLWEGGVSLPLGGVLYHLLRPAFDVSEQMLVQRQYVQGTSLPYAGREGAAAADHIANSLATLTRVDRPERD